MSTWTQLTGRTILQQYGIELGETTKCFERARDVGGYGGPWSFVLFVTEHTQPDMLKMCITTFDDEFLEAGFIPFTNRGGYLSLSKQEILDLIEVLEVQSTLLSKVQSDAKPVFRKLESADYAYFHIHPDWLPNSNQQYYQLIDQGGISTSISHNITLLSFITDRPPPNGDAEPSLFIANQILFSNELSFSIMHFPDHLLHNSSFHPDDDAQPYINLNHTSIRALIELFQAHIK